MTEDQARLGGVERLRIVIDLEVYGCHRDDVIDPVRYRDLIRDAVYRIKSGCVRMAVTTEEL